MVGNLWMCMADRMHCSMPLLIKDLSIVDFGGRGVAGSNLPWIPKDNWGVKNYTQIFSYAGDGGLAPLTSTSFRGQLWPTFIVTYLYFLLLALKVTPL